MGFLLFLREIKSAEKIDVMELNPSQQRSLNQSANVSIILANGHI